MDLIDEWQGIVAKAVQQADSLQTDEATKVDFVAPFIEALGTAPGAHAVGCWPPGPRVPEQRSGRVVDAAQATKSEDV